MAQVDFGVNMHFLPSQQISLFSVPFCDFSFGFEDGDDWYLSLVVVTGIFFSFQQFCYISPAYSDSLVFLFVCAEG